METLIPPNATANARAIAAACAGLGELPVVGVWNPALCPESALPALAWAMSVDEWSDTWPIDAKD